MAFSQKISGVRLVESSKNPKDLKDRDVRRPRERHAPPYKGTSHIRKCTPLRPYRRPMPRVLRASWGSGLFLRAKFPGNAAALGNADVVQMLLEAGADAAARNSAI